MFVTNWISTTKIQKISEITNFFRHYFLSRTEVVFAFQLPKTANQEKVLTMGLPNLFPPKRYLLRKKSSFLRNSKKQKRHSPQGRMPYSIFIPYIIYTV